MNNDEKIKAIIAYVENPPMSMVDLPEMSPMQIGVFNGMAAVASHVRGIAKDGDVEGELSDLFDLACKVSEIMIQTFDAHKKGVQ